ncbi:unnamed protein product, partial [Ectocarpus sp. 12 AP-2014]
MKSEDENQSDDTHRHAGRKATNARQPFKHRRYAGVVGDKGTGGGGGGGLSVLQIHWQRCCHHMGIHQVVTTSAVVEGSLELAVAGHFRGRRRCRRCRRLKQHSALTRLTLLPPRPLGLTHLCRGGSRCRSSPF